jgi:hypothetical protein
MAAKRKPDPPTQAGRSLAFMLGADDLKTPEQRKEFVEGVTDELFEQVQAERKRQGLPPLE